MTSGVICVLTNPAMPGLVKIGKTYGRDVQELMAELNESAGVPVPFVCEHACEVQDADELEKKVCEIFAENRYGENAFFEIPVEQAVFLLMGVGLDGQEISSGNTTMPQGRDRKRPRPGLSFAKMGISAGEKLRSMDDPRVYVEVTDVKKVSNRMVVYQGRKMSLIDITRRLRGPGRPWSLSPNNHWEYKGKPLIDIYNELALPRKPWWPEDE